MGDATGASVIWEESIMDSSLKMSLHSFDEDVDVQREVCRIHLESIVMPGVVEKRSK